MHVAVIDIGSPKNNNIGWALVGDKADCGTNLDECAKVLAQVLKTEPLALGFEAPMFVPMRNEPFSLTSARCGETGEGISRPFSASAGASVLVTSTVVVPYVLRCLRKTVPDVTATLDWNGWPNEPRQSSRMLLFEAFVTNQDKARQHFEDARLAAKELYTKLRGNKKIESSVTVDKCFSILGAMMLRTGLSKDISVLSQPCLVVRPNTE